MRFDLTDEEWAVIEPHLPKGGRGPARVDDRRVLNGIFYILRTGAPWRDLPRRYGPWQTVYHRFCAWQHDGVIDEVLRRLLLNLDANGFIDWDLWCVDGSNIRASRVAAGGVSSPLPPPSGSSNQVRSAT